METILQAIEEEKEKIKEISAVVSCIKAQTNNEVFDALFNVERSLDSEVKALSDLMGRIAQRTDDGK